MKSLMLCRTFNLVCLVFFLSLIEWKVAQSSKTGFRGTEPFAAEVTGWQADFADLTDVEDNGDSCDVVNDRPIVGILTQPYNGSSFEYLTAGYVKYIELAGARVVPLRYTADKKELRRLFDGINGLLLPGGSEEIKAGVPYFDVTSMLFDWAMDANSKGIYFPVWGTCQGFEQLIAFFDDKALTSSGKFDAEAFASGNTFVVNPMNSNMFKKMSDENILAYSTMKSSYNAHVLGVTPQVFYGNSNLSDFFVATSIGADRNNKTYIASIEARNGWPIFGVQFHPEKVIYEWAESFDFPHFPEAISLAQYFANFFVSECRCNENHFNGGYQTEQAALVEVSNATIVSNMTQYMSQIYLWES